MRMENEVMSYFTLRMHIDNYPHLLGNYLSENEEWWGWWQTEDSP